MPLRNLQLPIPELPINVEASGVRYLQEIQTKISNRILVGNMLFAYLCTLATFRWLVQGN